MEKKSFKIKEPLVINERNRNFWIRFFRLGFDFEKSQYSNDLNFRNALNNLSLVKIPNNNSYRIEQYSLDRVISEARNLSKDIFDGVDMRVPFFIYEIDEKENRDLLQMYNKIDLLAKKNIINEEQYIKNAAEYFIKNTTRRSAFGIPVDQVKFNTSSGLVEGKLVEGPCIIPYKSLEGFIKFVKMVGPLNERIWLGKNANSLTVGTYIHEIAHCLLDRNRGVVENYFNDEFLSIFMEKVAIDLNDKTEHKMNLKIAEIIRVKDMQESLKDLLRKKSLPEERYDSIKYIQSGILAGILFDKYEKADKEGKEKILSEVRDILNGKSKVQSIIDEENLSMEDSKLYFDKVEGYIEELNKSKEEPSGR